MNELKRTLIASGYQQTARVDQPLCFASRGGIIDIIPSTAKNAGAD